MLNRITYSTSPAKRDPDEVGKVRRNDSLNKAAVAGYQKKKNACTLTCLIIVFFTALFINITTLPAQISNVKFQHLQTRDGLSQSNVLTIIQSHDGFMWFGTREGLNKYDGYGFTVYKHSQKDKNSLSSNSLTQVIESHAGDIWVATRGGGVSRFIKNKNLFIAYKHDDKNSNSISSNFTNAIAEDNNGNIWIGTEDHGLDMLDVKQNRFTHYKHNSNDPKSLSDDFIKVLYIDKQQQLWIATVNGGLNLFHTKDASFSFYKHNDAGKNSISSNDITSLFEDSQNRFWVGTNGGGLNIMNRQKGTFEKYKPVSGDFDIKNSIFAIGEDVYHRVWVSEENKGLYILDTKAGSVENYIHDDIDNNTIGDNSIYTIYKDAKGNMWMGNFSAGVDMMNIDNQFAHYKHSLDEHSLSNNRVLCIFEDSKKRIWVGTDGGGLNLFNPVEGRFVHFKKDPDNPNSLGGDYVLHITEDNKGNLWIGTWGDGLTIFNPEQNSFKHFLNKPGDINSLSSNNAWTILKDADNNMWVGTFGGGLNLYNPATNNFTRYSYNSKVLNDGTSNENIESLFDDKQGNLWIGTDGGGINILNKKNRIFSRFTYDGKTNMIPSNSIDVIFQDSKKRFWISTNAGLCMLNNKTGFFKVYTTSDGLPTDNIFGVLEDKKGNIWLSSSNGIAMLNPETNEITKYNTADGLQATEFKEYAFCKSSSGAMYFGGNNGFNVFYPDAVKNQHFYEPPLVLTSFKISNREVAVSADSAHPTVLKTDISQTHSITIPYDSSVIEFQFAALNFTSYERKKYSYKLEGFDADWTEFRTRRTAIYTNLDPNKYVFKVRTLDNNGNISKRIISCELIITPPFWLTWWFKALVILTIAASIITIYKLRLRTIKAQKRVLEKEVEKRTEQLTQSTQLERKARKEAEKARQEAEKANKAKSVFLATMSHEIRTPMNGVIGMASLLAETPLTGEQQGYTETIRHCGEALLNIINDILDFSKIESGNLELEHADFDLRNCIEEVLDVFATKAAQIGLDLVYQIDHNVPSQIMGDSLRLRQILLNLVSNAVKFTHHGEVFIKVFIASKEENSNEFMLGFSVKDTGVGIPKDKLGRLFKAFSQVDSSTTRKYGGTGLGLVICEKLIHMMGGNIAVESTPEVGTTFFFNIKTSAGNISSRNYVHSNLASIEGKRVLIVDDNETNRIILQSQLQQLKLVTQSASSGAEALGLLNTQNKFELVVSDMHMPEMDGLELSIKIHEAYPALPIIMLSSVGDERAKEYSKIFAAILSKPVKQQQLITHILEQLRNNGKAEHANIDIKRYGDQKLSATLAETYPLRILIAEDDYVNQKLAIRVLNKLGYDPHLASNGKEALQKALSIQYDIIFMDVQMPEMDGCETTQAIIKSMPSHLKPVIIAMTANAMQGDREACLQAGMDDYISKPINFNALIERIEKWATHIKSKSAFIAGAL